MLAAEVKTTNFLLLKLFLSIPQAGYTLGDASYLDIFQYSNRNSFEISQPETNHNKLPDTPCSGT